MAWVTEYDLRWISMDGTSGGDIFIQRDNGSYQQPLLLSRESLEIRNVFPNWESHVGRMNCSFSVENDLSDFYELLPLMTISAGQLKVVVTFDGLTSAGGGTLFEGYLNCEAVSQDMVHYSSIQLTASGLLSKLERIYPTSIDTVQNLSLIDVIDNCLTLTGSSYNIRVNSTLYELAASLSSGQTLYNRTALYTELFWKNNIERIMAIDILESILRSFDAYLYWNDGYWYIEHYMDVGAALLTPYQKTYVEYTSGVSYNGAATGSNQVVTFGVPPDVHDPVNRPQVHGRQVLSVNPGLNELDIKKDQKLFFNMLNADLSGLNISTDPEPLPDRRGWEAYDNDPGIEWQYPGLQAFNIANAVYRWGYDITNGSQQLNGLTTRFLVTVHPDTQLTIKFKWLWVAPYPGFLTDPSNYDFHFYWYLRTPSDDYIHYLVSAGTWELMSSGTPSTGYNIQTVGGGEFDPDLHSVEVSITIDLGEAFNPSDHIDTNLIFRWGTELIEPLVSGSTIPALFSYVGDFEATISETLEDNLIRGDQVTDFLEKKTITLDLFDSTWSYRNSMLYWFTGTADWSRLTEDWTYDGVTLMTLDRWLMSSRFRLYLIARQKISVDYIYQGILQLMQIWTDSKQSGKYFILGSDIYLPESNQHSVELWEYDDTTTINLI